MGYINTGYERARSLRIIKNLGGEIVDGYPKIYSILAAFDAYAELTATELAQLPLLDYQERLAAFILYVEDIEEIEITDEGARQENTTSCPVVIEYIIDDDFTNDAPFGYEEYGADPEERGTIEKVEVTGSAAKITCLVDNNGTFYQFYKDFTQTEGKRLRVEVGLSGDLSPYYSSYLRVQNGQILLGINIESNTTNEQFDDRLFELDYIIEANQYTFVRKFFIFCTIPDETPPKAFFIQYLKVSIV